MVHLMLVETAHSILLGVKIYDFGASSVLLETAGTSDYEL